jgi:hypothetical protein
MGDGPVSKLKAHDANLDQLLVHGRAMCPEADLHFLFNATPKALEQLLNIQKARYAYEKGLAEARAALRTAHLKLAETNATMASLIGKTYLSYGQPSEADDDEAFDFVGAADRVRAKVFALDPANRIRGGEEGDREA